VAGAAPAPVAGLGAEACADRILEHVLARVGEVGLVLDDARAETGAEEVAATAVAEVEALCVTAAQVLHASGEARLSRLDDEVVVVAHQAEDVDRPVVALDGDRQKPQEREPVLVVARDRGPVDTARRDVEVAVGQRGAQDARHPRKLARRRTGIASCGRIDPVPTRKTCLQRPRPRV
jgi:hypothetical protein